MSSSSLLNDSWSRSLNEKDPPNSVHHFAVPPIGEIISLLPLAYRMTAYSANERQHGREPIFDLNGFTMSPPNPGPYSGCPIGGMGGGAIGRGFRGDFRRWSLHPGKYIHRSVDADQLSIRIKRGSKVFAQVLSIFDAPTKSCLSSWKWSVPAASVRYSAVFPRALHVFTEPVPGVVVTIKQLSPFIPDSYSEACLPCGVFSVDVTRIASTKSGSSGNHNEEIPAATAEEAEDLEVSVMLSFQNGDGGDDDACGGKIHRSFSLNNSDSIASSDSTDTNCHSVSVGVTMSYTHITTASSEKSSSSLLSAFGLSARTTERETIGDNCSFAIYCATEPEEQQQQDKGAAGSPSPVLSYCSQFVTEFSSDVSTSDRETNSKSAEALWIRFVDTGDISDADCAAQQSDDGDVHEGGTEVKNGCPFVSKKGCKVASAVCMRKTLSSSEKSKVFSFALAWDSPVARFGSGKGIPRYHTRFFGRSGSQAGSLCVYALMNAKTWEDRICDWQKQALDSASGVDKSFNPADHGGTFRTDTAYPNRSQDYESEALPDYYKSQLFNELYYLVDAGTIWSDTCAGKANEVSTSFPLSPLTRPDHSINLRSQAPYVLPDVAAVTALREAMLAHDCRARECAGDQTVVGQFLYLEGHEYLMYNTYDVHFYASFALLQLFPQLELSIQRDFASSVPRADSRSRRMLATGDIAPRKLPRVVPHDLGSPFETPWEDVNAYNLQDVSQWKDLGPKFVLQVYRDFRYLSEPQLYIAGSAGDTSRSQAMRFLEAVYPSVKTVMKSTEAFDKDGDGMIENCGFPDQTYDVWSAQGTQAYCGGLWIAACMAMAEMAGAIAMTTPHYRDHDQGNGKDLRHDAPEDLVVYYKSLASRARAVYIQKLWTGRYLKYDSSVSSHHDSVMADMLAGHWYARVCGLDGVVSAEVASSCLNEIFRLNVGTFGAGRMLGAVNGMKPDGAVDSSCLQSREVWVGTTYTLAATMLHEATHKHTIERTSEHTTRSHDSSSSRHDDVPAPRDVGKEIQNQHCAESSSGSSGPYHTKLPSLPVSLPVPVPTSASTASNSNSPSSSCDTNSNRDAQERLRLRRMAFDTASGVYEAGWSSFGYWFATPEAWERNGNYRSLGYMRPLGIWAMQYALVCRSGSSISSGACNCEEQADVDD